MKAASQLPSGVLTTTSVSASGRSAALAAGAPATAANPAANDTAPNSRRDTAVSGVVSFGFTSSLTSASISQANPSGFESGGHHTAERTRCRAGSEPRTSPSLLDP